MCRKSDQSVTVPDPGDILFPRIPVEALRAYSVGRLPDEVVRVRGLKHTDDGQRVRVIRIKVDGEWIPL